MKRIPAHIRIGRAYGEAYQKKILEDAGATVFYKDQPDKAAASCRKGEGLLVVGLRGLGSSEAKILAALAILHKNDAAAVDAATGRRSDGKDGPALMREASVDLRNERLGGHSAAAKDGAKGGAKSGEAKRAKKTPLALAEKDWFDKSLTTAEALAKVNSHGYLVDWEPGTLRKALGKRGVTVGRVPAGGRKAPPESVQDARRRLRRGYVYFIRISGRGPVKIGFATALKSRLGSHATSNHAKIVLVAAMHGTMKMEKALHHKYRALTIPGKREWFKMAEPLKSFIAGLPELDDEYND